MIASSRAGLRITAFAGASVLLSVAAGCGGSGAGVATTRALPSAVKADVANGATTPANVVAANNNLGFAVLGQLLQTDTRDNVFISPTSIALALDMTYNGAAGTTQTAMAQALQLSGISLQDLNAGEAALQASMVDPGTDITLSVANSLWIRGGVVKPTFVTANQTYYGAMVGDIAQAPSAVNSWVSTQTAGKITDILPSNVNYATMVAILVNALYFKGTWQQPFSTSATHSATFTLADSSQTTCSMMSEGGTYSYFQGVNFQLVSLPYGKGRFCMQVLLPSSGTSLSSLLSGLSLSTWNGWLAQMQYEQGSISLPRFTSDYGVSLKNALTSLGMGVAFDINNANFSNLGTITPLYIAFVQHKTTVAVDEAGTEAAAATSVGVGTTATPGPSFAMTIDHPFFYTISDSATGQILFLGVMLNPTTKGS